MEQQQRFVVYFFLKKKKKSISLLIDSCVIVVWSLRHFNSVPSEYKTKPGRQGLGPRE